MVYVFTLDRPNPPLDTSDQVPHDTNYRIMPLLLVCQSLDNTPSGHCAHMIPKTMGQSKVGCPFPLLTGSCQNIAYGFATIEFDGVFLNIIILLKRYHWTIVPIIRVSYRKRVYLRLVSCLKTNNESHYELIFFQRK